MKRSFSATNATLGLLLVFASAGGLAARANAQGSTTFTGIYSVGTNVPDNSATGVTNTQAVATAITAISQVRLTLTLAGTPNATDAFNGDFYATLTHGGSLAVLLNRAGRTATNPVGYGDSGFSVTFNDLIASPDIHLYQTTTNPGGGTLTGNWGSDGRNVNPALSLDTTARTARLTTFAGLDPNGDWSLLIADVSPTGTGRFVGWQLEIIGTSVPEPTATAFFAVGVLTSLLALRRRRGTS